VGEGSQKEMKVGSWGERKRGEKKKRSEGEKKFYRSQTFPLIWGENIAGFGREESGPKRGGRAGTGEMCRQVS